MEVARKKIWLYWLVVSVVCSVFSALTSTSTNQLTFSCCKSGINVRSCMIKTGTIAFRFFCILPITPNDYSRVSDTLP